MAEPKGDIKFDEMIEQGWEFSHVATVNHYRPAGTVSSMKSVGDYEYCRIHRGKTVGRHTYQLTYVMRRKIAA